MWIDPSEAERYLHTHIPVSASMGIGVSAVDADGVRLTAPIAANVNHRSTVFGGSASAVAILAGWTLVWAGLRDAELRGGIVIQRNSMEYLRPITGDFEAFCSAPVPEAWEYFLDTLRRRSRARIVLDVEVFCDGDCACTFQGTYVAMLGEGASG